MLSSGQLEQSHLQSIEILNLNLPFAIGVIPLLRLWPPLAYPLKSLFGPAAPLLTPIATGGRAVAATALAALAVAAQQPAATAAPTDYSNNPSAPTPVTANSLGAYIFEGQVKHYAGSVPTANINSDTCLSQTNVPTPPYNCADYITINIPSGFVISRINLDYYNSADDRAFIGFQSGAQFNTATGFVGSGMVAYNHFGWRGLCATSYGSLRLANTNNPVPPSATYNCTDGTNTEPVSTPGTTNLLTKVYTATPASPIPGTLGSGDYTFWIQQVSGDSSYQFTVQSTPTPAPLPVIGAAAAFGWSRRLRLRLRARSLG